MTWEALVEQYNRWSAGLKVGDDVAYGPMTGGWVFGKVERVTENEIYALGLVWIRRRDMVEAEVGRTRYRLIDPKSLLRLPPPFEEG